MRVREISAKCIGVIVAFLLTGNAAHAAERLTIVYTNSLNGYLDYCHCASNPNGGLVKRATEFKSIKSSHRNTVFLDTGDNLTYDPDPVGAHYVIKAMKYLGYDALAPGDQELSAGTDSFISMMKEMPFLCGNLQVKHRGRWTGPFTGHRFIERGGIKAAVIGTISPDAFRFYPESVRGSVRVMDQSGELKKTVRGMGNSGTEFIILLSHSGYERDVEIAREIREIDVIVGGHSQTLLKNPVKIGGTVIVQAGSNGAHIGILELAVDGGSVVSFRNSFRRPDEFRPADDPHIRGLINEYREKLKKDPGAVRFK